MGDDELWALLGLHEQWVESGGKEGERANLAEANLTNTDLAGRNLEQADLHDADLTGANLEGARLRGACFDSAILSNANLQDTDLRQTTFRDADLTNADLDTSRGLSLYNLAGTDLTGASLPISVDPGVHLTRLNDVSTSIRKALIVLLLVCSYSIVRILTTNVEHLLRNGSVVIPYVQTEAPIRWFFSMMPLVVAMIYLFFLSFLNELWSSIKRSPAVFSDGSDLKMIPYSWIFTGFAQQHMTHRMASSDKFTTFCSSIFFYLVFFMTIMTLVASWMHYMPIRNLFVTFYHAFLISAVVLCTFLFVRYSVWKNARSVSFIRKCIIVGSCVSLIGLVHVISFQTFVVDYDRYTTADGCPSSIVSSILCRFGYSSFIHVRGKKLSSSPANWSDRISDLDNDWSSWSQDSSAKIQSFFSTVEGANLEELDLRSADAQDVFLIKAQLDGTYMRRADMKFADLRLADLVNADLSDAYLSFADLRRARLTGADLRGAFLDSADLRGANLVQANLAGTRLDGADLRGATWQGWATPMDAKGLHLTGADLRDARLPGADLKGGHLDEADLEGAILVQTDLVGATLDRANLKRARLGEANLSSASLRNADLQGADLSDAVLDYADLTGARLDKNESITEAQLDTACANGEVALPDRFSGLRLRSCPP